MLGYTTKDKNLLYELQQRVNDLENQVKYLGTIVNATGTPYLNGIYIWDPDQNKYILLTVSGLAGLEQINLTIAS